MSLKRLTVGIIGAIALGAMALPNLAAQGAQYDELHQAVGAFAYCGRPNGLFNPLTVFSLPVLNMTYSGAVKTAMFGLWLRATGCTFTITAWRMCGVLIAALGVGLFSVVSRSRLFVIGVVLALLTTDATIILGIRHDYGPVALAFTIRMIIVAIWLRFRNTEHVSAGWSFALGALTGFAAFEKVSSLVLLPVLSLFIVTDVRLRSRRFLLPCAAGLGVGLVPLIAVNLYSWTTTRQLISASQATLNHLEWASLPIYLGSYLSTGAGSQLQRWILGIDVDVWRSIIEGSLILVLLGSAAIIAFRNGQAPGALNGGRSALIAAGAYFLCLIGTWLLPAETEVHHWIVGTPFQYIAFGLTASDPASRESRRLFTFGLLLLLLFRVPGLVAMESAVREGRFGPEWHPDLTKVGTWASEKGDDTVFVVADWGIGTQIACFSSGRHKPTELFWDYHRREQFSEAISSSKTRVYYLLALREPSPVNPEATRRLTDDAPTMDGWQEQQVDPEAGALTTLIIRRFVRRSISP